jgi:hypothetical protein
LTSRRSRSPYPPAPFLGTRWQHLWQRHNCRRGEAEERWDARKTKKKRSSFHIPLTAADALDLDRWAETPITFKARDQMDVAEKGARLRVVEQTGP